MVFAGAKLDKISFLGTQMSFENPEVIYWYLKGFLIYFLYRFYLYIKQEPDLYLKSTFYNQLNATVLGKLVKIKNKLYPDVTEHGGEYDFRKMEKTGLLTRNVSAVVKRSDNGSVINGAFEINILAFTWDGVKALLHTTFNRSYATDYLLPFLMAFFALAVGWQYHG